MRRTVRFTALLLAVLLALPLAAGAAAPSAISPKEHWFTGDDAVYHHGLAEASMVLNAAVYDQTEVDSLAAAGFSTPVTYTEQTIGQLALLDHTIASTTVGSQPVTVVVFRDPTLPEQLQSLVDFDGRNHGFTPNGNQEVPVLLSSALSAMGHLNLEENTCVWVTGSGFGGAAAELLAALLNGETFTQEGVDYAYTGPAVSVRTYAFGSPAVSLSGSENHENIFIINNPEDLLVYLPGESWGYRHFGQVLWTDTFYGTQQASADMRNAVNQRYQEISEDTYYTFSTDDYNTNDTPAALADYISSSIAPTLDDYYNTTYDTKVVSNLEILTLMFGRPTTKRYTTYNLISEALAILAGAQSDSFVCLAVGTYLYGSDTAFYPVIRFIFEHALDLNFSLSSLNATELKKLTDLKKQFDSGETPKTYEMVCAHTPSSYLAWVMAAKSPADLSSGAAGRIDWVDLTVSGSEVTCSADLSGESFLWLAVYREDGKMLTIQPLENGTVYDSQTISGAGFAKLFLLDSYQTPAAPAISSN